MTRSYMCTNRFHYLICFILALFSRAIGYDRVDIVYANTGEVLTGLGHEEPWGTNPFKVITAKMTW